MKSIASSAEKLRWSISLGLGGYMIYIVIVASVLTSILFWRLAKLHLAMQLIRMNLLSQDSVENELVKIATRLHELYQVLITNQLKELNLSEQEKNEGFAGIVRTQQDGADRVKAKFWATAKLAHNLKLIPSMPTSYKQFLRSEKSE